MQSISTLRIHGFILNFRNDYFKLEIYQQNSYTTIYY